MRKIVVGILAHVDAGKTTLSEGLLYVGGKLRKLGRVDNRDAFLDTDELEKERGITIFSKQAMLSFGGLEITLLDTPGHVDFSAEMERSLQVMDYAILVISGADGVQGHTRTLWKLLQRYHIPVFLFINKMDQEGTSKERLLEELRQKLDEACVDFSRTGEEFYESVALCDEGALELFLEKGELTRETIGRLIGERKVFPCLFGSALRLAGVKELLEAFDAYGEQKMPLTSFGARVFKISRDAQGNRLTYLKVTGGCLKVKMLLPLGEGREPEKINQIRLYSGARYETVSEAGAGTICAVTGPEHTRPGEGLGAEVNFAQPVLEPVLSCRLLLPPNCDGARLLPRLRQLEEEDPQLHIRWEEESREIQVRLMGQVQTEVLKELIRQRLDVDVDFGPGRIVYKETIAGPVEGVGHYEPLRHYAEVHLLLEPGEPGSGVQTDVRCPEDMLDKNWQRLILTHLEEKQHRGVLTGAALTDVKITLVAGRAHQKHTEGGDFREAVYRAVRQGLMEAESVLLEPWYAFSIELPRDMAGRAMSDIEKRCGRFEPIIIEGDTAFLKGEAPAACMQDYAKEVAAYTRGNGRLFCALKGYAPCHNAQEVIEAFGYDALRDSANPSCSVFCSHGAGFIVHWDKVKEYMHVESVFAGAGKESQEQEIQPGKSTWEPEQWIDEEEIEAIFAQTFYANKRDKSGPARKYTYSRTRLPQTPYRTPAGDGKKRAQENYLLVDGYNIIFAWEELKALALDNLDGARGRLMDILCNYQGFCGCQVIVVFDAYRVKGQDTQVLDYHNIHVVYTREAETADQYIEKFAHENGRKYNVTVATSDGLEQMIIRGQGCGLLSARELQEAVRAAAAAAWQRWENAAPEEKNRPFQELLQPEDEPCDE